MFRRLLVLAVGLFWAFFVFLLVVWLTFPGDAISTRVEYEVGKSGRNQYALELGDVSPWWIGLSTSSLKLYTKERGSAAPNKLTLIATDARGAAGFFSLLSLSPTLSGSMTLGLDGELDYVVETGWDEKGKDLMVTGVTLEGPEFPIAELIAFLPNSEFENATGDLDIKVELAAAEGIGKADGEIDLQGKGLTLVNPIIMDFPLGRDVEITQLDFVLDVDEGKAKVDRGTFDTDVARIQISGDITLKDDINRSNANLTVEIELDESMSMLAPMLKSAEKNGKYVYECRGTLERLANACRPAGRRGRRPGRDRAERPSRPARDASDRVASKGTDSADRDARRKELQERLKKRREDRRKEREARRAKLADEEDDEEPLDDEPLDDEPIDEDFEDEEDGEDEEFFDE